MGRQDTRQKSPPKQLKTISNSACVILSQVRDSENLRFRLERLGGGVSPFLEGGGRFLVMGIRELVEYGFLGYGKGVPSCMVRLGRCVTQIQILIANSITLSE